MNDEGLYGFGQLATILRARYGEPKISSLTKTDGLTFRVKEILGRVFEGKVFPPASRNGADKTTDVPSVAVATARAEAEVSTAVDHAGDTTPTCPRPTKRRSRASPRTPLPSLRQTFSLTNSKMSTDTLTADRPARN